MKIVKKVATGVVAVFAMVAMPTAFASANQANLQTGPEGDKTASAAAIACNSRLSAANSAGQDIFVSSGNPRTYTGTSWQNVECSGTTFRLPYGKRAVVISNFNAEADCNGSANGQWCQTRALLNGAEGQPVAAEPSSFAFDSTAGGSQNWQAHSMQRAWQVRCASTNGCQYRFVVQTRMHSSTVTGLWLDEVATHLRINIGAPAPL